MMTGLIKMEQIDMGHMTMELYNYLPEKIIVLKTAFHQGRKTGGCRNEERIQEAMKQEENKKNLGWRQNISSEFYLHSQGEPTVGA